MPRRSIFGEVKDTNKRGQCQIYSNIAERKYLRQAKDTKSRKQCKLICFLPRRNILGAAKVRFSFVSPRPAEDVPDAAGGAMPPSAWAAAGFRSSAAAEERIFRNCILAGFRSAGSHCENSGSSDDTCASARSDRAKTAHILRDRSVTVFVRSRRRCPADTFGATFCHQKVAKTAPRRKNRIEVRDISDMFTDKFC